MKLKVYGKNWYLEVLSKKSMFLLNFYNSNAWINYFASVRCIVGMIFLIYLFIMDILVLSVDVIVRTWCK